LNRPIHGGNRDWAAAIAKCPVSELIDFSASINPLGPPKSVLNAIKGGLDGIIHYPDPNYTELRKALASKHQISPDWILPGNGVAELLNWAARDLGELGLVYVLSPGFADYARALKSFGIRIASCPLEISTGKWNTKNNSKKSGLILNNPHNPTGHLWKSEEILPLLEEYELVVLDEAFLDFLSNSPSLIPWIENHPNLIILRSLTKFYSLPGLRIGYAIAHPDRLKRWKKWRDPWPVNILADLAVRAAVNDHEFQHRSWEWLNESSPILFTNLTDIEGLNPRTSSVNFFLVHSNQNVPKLQKRLLQDHKILIRDCLSFIGLDENYFRIAIKTLRENQILIEALKSCYEV